VIFIGIDPGKSGGIAVLDPQGTPLATTKMLETERDLWAWLQQFDDARATIELVHAMPKQGVTSTFTFGRSYGFLRGLLVALTIPFEEVRPQRWQKELGCTSKGDKNVTKQKAQQLWPELRVTHAIADALLIAEYGRRTHR